MVIAYLEELGIPVAVILPNDESFDTIK